MYSHYFGFTTQPFTGLENQVFLSNPTYQETYSCLRRNLAERRGLLLLTGVAGSGKTTLLRHLMADLKDRNRFILLWNTHLSFDDLLDYLCDNLDLRVEGSGVMEKIHALEVYLITRLSEDHRVILILDDAQNLSDETLKDLHHLARLETVGRRLLQIILSAQPLLENRLARTPNLEPLYRDVAEHCYLEALDDETVIHYINEHLHSAGYGGSGEDLFEEAALNKIITYSQGVPRLINLICNQALLLAYLNSEERVSAKMVRRVGTNNLVHQKPNLSVPLEDSHSTESAISPVPPSSTPLRPIPVAPAQSREDDPVHHQSDFSAESIAIPRSPQTRRRRRPRMILIMVFVAIIGTAATIQAFDISLNLNRLSWPLISQNGSIEESNTYRTVDIPIPPLDTTQEPAEAISDESLSIRTPQPSNMVPLVEPKQLQPTVVPTQTGTADQLSSLIEAGESQPSVSIEEIPLTTTEPPIASEEKTPETAMKKAVPPSEPIPTAPHSAKVRRIETLLAEAEQHMAMYRYTIPHGDNAIQTYREVLSLDPDNAEALQGIEHIKSDYLRWANDAYARGETAKAQKQLEKALTVDPNDENVRRLLEEMRQKQN